MAMTLLDHYLRAVRVYLPRRVPREDILDELAELLQSKVDEREHALGRPLSDVEQQAVLIEHGNPTTVAARYGGTNLGLAFGRQIIGPELFPLYLSVLLMQFVATFVIAVVFGPYMREPLLSPPYRILLPILVQFCVTTLVFASIEIFQRRERRRTPSAGPFLWFPPAYRQRIPRWQSISGLVVLGIAAIWWAAIPGNPALVLGSAVSSLRLTEPWHTFHWPILLVLMTGVVQRVFTLVRPEWNVLQFVTRLCTNGAMLAMVYPILQQFPYVVVAGGVHNGAADITAGRFNELLWWHIFLTGGLYWLIAFGWHAWLCLQRVRSSLRNREVIA